MSIPNYMTKDDEIARMAEIVASLPRNSYLAGYMEGAVEHFTDLVRSDLAIPRVNLVRSLETDCRLAEAQLTGLKAQVKAEQDGLRAYQRHLQACKDDMDDLRKVACRLAAVR